MFNFIMLGESQFKLQIVPSFSRYFLIITFASLCTFRHNTIAIVTLLNAYIKSAVFQNNTTPFIYAFYIVTILATCSISI